MLSANKLIYALLGLVILMIIGMLTGSWRIILYPYLLIIGLSILLGLTKKRSLSWVPTVATVLYVFLYLWLDIVTINSPTGGNSYVFGMVPATAIFLLGIWPTAILTTLLYAWTFPVEESTLQESPASTIQKTETKM